MSVERPELSVERSAPRGAVFLSYASQDAEAAKRICEALRAAGVEVWFDQSELRGGDAWDQKIRRQIKECALFMPIISAATQARPEGYFRLEWRLADQRTHLMGRHRAFLLPVSVDATPDAEADVPDSFSAVQWTRLPGGETSAAFCARVKQLLSGGVPAPPAREEQNANRPGQRPARQGRPRALRHVWVAVSVVIVLGYAWRLYFSSSHSRETVLVAPKAGSEARELVGRAREIFDGGHLTREHLDAAEKLIEQAKIKDPTDGEVWAAAAQVSNWFVFYHYDQSDTRRQQARTAVANALNFAPQSFEARFAQACVLVDTIGTPEVRPEAERLLRQLLREKPEVERVADHLGLLLRNAGRAREAAEMFLRAKNPAGAAWTYLLAGDLAQAVKAVDQALQTDPAPDTLVLKAILEIDAHEDLAAAQRAIDEIPPSARLGESVASMQIWISLARRETGRTLDTIRALPQDYISAPILIGPKRAYAGIALHQAGREEAARAEWRAALDLVERRLQVERNDLALLYWKAALQIFLGETAEGEKTLRLGQEFAGLQPDEIDPRNFTVFVALGRRDDVIAALTELFRRRPPLWESVHSLMRYSPSMDPLRGDPRFEKLLRDNLPAGAKPFDEPKPAAVAAPAPDDKSVAVLAFANLSDDKANEYFSDGISEELLNVLAKVPGLKVTARTSSFHFKGKDTAISEIARQLGVAYVVEGSVRKAGNKVRITAQLIKAADGFHVWSDDFDRELKDIFAVQDEIAAVVAKNLQLKLGAPARSAGPVDPEAYQFYLQGRQALQLRTVEGYDEAEKWFNRSQAIAPSWAPVYAALADVARLRIFGGIDDTTGPNRPWPPGLLRAKALAEQALALDSGLAEAYVALAGTYMLAWNLTESERLVHRAIELNPNEAAAYLVLGRLCAAQGRMDESIAAFRRGVELNPLAPRILDNLAAELNFAGRYEEGWNVIQRAAALQPDGAQIQCYQARLLANLGRREEALRMAEKLLKNPDGSETTMLHIEAAAVFSRFGRQAEAQALIAAVPADSAVHPIGLAYIGRADAAAAELDRINFGWLEDVLWGSSFDSIRQDPRLVALMRRVGLVEAQERASAWRAAHGVGPAPKP